MCAVCCVGMDDVGKTRAREKEELINTLKRWVLQLEYRSAIVKQFLDKKGGSSFFGSSSKDKTNSFPASPILHQRIDVFGRRIEWDLWSSDTFGQKYSKSDMAYENKKEKEKQNKKNHYSFYIFFHFIFVFGGLLHCETVREKLWEGIDTPEGTSAFLERAWTERNGSIPSPLADLYLNDVWSDRPYILSIIADNTPIYAHGNLNQLVEVFGSDGHIYRYRMDQRRKHMY